MMRPGDHVGFGNTSNFFMTLPYADLKNLMNRVGQDLEMIFRHVIFPDEFPVIHPQVNFVFQNHEEFCFLRFCVRFEVRLDRKLKEFSSIENLYKRTLESLVDIYSNWNLLPHDVPGKKSNLLQYNLSLEGIHFSQWVGGAVMEEFIKNKTTTIRRVALNQCSKQTKKGKSEFKMYMPFFSDIENMKKFIDSTTTSVVGR